MSGNHFNPTDYWAPSPRNINRMGVNAPEEERKASPDPTPPAMARNGGASTVAGSGRPAVSSPLSSTAAGDGGVYGRNLIPPRSEAQDEDEILSNASKDSFDWVGDEKYEGEDYEEILMEQLGAKPLSQREEEERKKEQPASLLSAYLPINFFNNLLLIVFMICMLIFLFKIFRVSLPHLGGVSFYRWATIVFAFIFVPVWVNTGIVKLIRAFGGSPLAKTDVPARLEDIRYCLTACVAALILCGLWYQLLPTACAPIDPGSDGEPIVNPICYFAFAPRLFFFVFIAGFVSAIDSLIMTTIKSSFQERTFKTRLVESRFKVFVVDQLLFAAKHEQLARKVRAAASRDDTNATPSTSNNAVKPSAIVSNFMFNLPFLIPEQLQKLAKRLRSDCASGTYAHLPSSVNQITGEFDEFKQELLQTIHESGYETVAKAPPMTDYDAKMRARMIFHYLCPEDNNYLTIKDFKSIIPSDAACRDAYYVFDYDKDGTITKAEFRSAMVRIFREQRNLAQSVANTGSALSILDTISRFLIGGGLFLLFLALFGVKVQNILTLMVSVVLGLNFIVFDGANKTFGSLLFLFLIHPYDVGDRIVIGRDVSNDEDILTVVQINIQCTIFRKWNGLVVSLPNHVLASGAITNLSRANEQWERVEFELFAPDQMKLTVDEETEKLSDLRKRIDVFVLQYPQDYYQAFELRAVVAADNAKADKNLDRIRFVLKIRCKETIDSQKKWIRHARILAFVKQAVQRAGVEFAATAA